MDGILRTPILTNTYPVPPCTDAINRANFLVLRLSPSRLEALGHCPELPSPAPIFEERDSITPLEEAAARASKEARPQHHAAQALGAIKRQARLSKARASTVTCCGVGAAPTPVPAAAPAPATAPATAVAAAATTTVVRAAMFARRGARVCAGAAPVGAHPRSADGSEPRDH